MDVSMSIDPLDDNGPLPELSFEDLLDESPGKKQNESIDDDLDDDNKSLVDDTLNTPRPKKMPQQMKVAKSLATPVTTINCTSTPIASTSMATVTTAKSDKFAAISAVRTTNISTVAISPLKTNKGTIIATGATSVKTASQTTAPILLNGKNLLPKSIASTATVVKLSSKVSVTSPTASRAASTSNLTAGKTAIRTSQGQILYIQKAAPTGTSTTTGTATSLASKSKGTSIVHSSPNVGNSGSKTVAIKVIRASSGSLMPVKSAAATLTTSSASSVTTVVATTAAPSKSTLTLSPNIATQLSGKRIITTSGGQVTFLKTSPRATSNQTTGVITNIHQIPAKPIVSTAASTSKVDGAGSVTTTSVTTKAVMNISVSGTGSTGTGKKIYVQSANGKQILVSNPHLIKLPARTMVTGTSTSTTTAVTTPSSGGAKGSTTQLQTLQISGKPMQYVRVVPKIAATTTSGTATTTTTTTGPSASTGGTSTSSGIKILNAGLPQKFTVVRPSQTTKLVLTQSPRKEGGAPITFSPITTKVQKTIVTLPTMRAPGDNQNSAGNSSSGNMQTFVRSISQSASGSASGNGSGSNAIVRKQKISEINNELQRLTNSHEDEDSNISSGAPEAKKHRIVVLKGAIMRPCAGTASAVKQVTVQGIASGVRDFKHVSGVSNSDSDKSHSNGKQSPLQQQQQQFLNTALKTNSFGLTGATAAERKSLLICGKAQALMAQKQQHKIFQLKRRAPDQIQSAIYVNKPMDISNNNNNNNDSNNRLSGSSNISKLPIRIKMEPLEQADLKSALLDTNGIVRRKHCNCSKSQCLKLYCDCFANGEFCQDCTCKDCFNNLQYEDERQRAIKICLERNPSAFKPKITTSQEQGGDMRHNKGCNCKRSGCLKNYCECYEAKIPCSDNCKCIGCRNFEDRPDLDMDPIDPKLLASLTTNPTMSVVGQKRSYDNANDKSDFSTDKIFKNEPKGLETGSQMFACAFGSSTGNASGSGITLSGGIGVSCKLPEKQQCNFITQEVVDATIQCMLSQADECTKNGLSVSQTEKMVMEEMGRCLVEIIDFSIRNTDTSFTQE